jgi:hypothetical protein
MERDKKRGNFPEAHPEVQKTWTGKCGQCDALSSSSAPQPVACPAPQSQRERARILAPNGLQARRDLRRPQRLARPRRPRIAAILRSGFYESRPG